MHLARLPKGSELSFGSEARIRRSRLGFGRYEAPHGLGAISVGAEHDVRRGGIVKIEPASLRLPIIELGGQILHEGLDMLLSYVRSARVIFDAYVRIVRCEQLLVD